MTSSDESRQTWRWKMWRLRELVSKPITSSYLAWLWVEDPMQTPLEWTNECKGWKWPKLPRLDSGISDAHHWHERYTLWMIDPYERCKTKWMRWCNLPNFMEKIKTRKSKGCATSDISWGRVHWKNYEGNGLQNSPKNMPPCLSARVIRGRHSFHDVLFRMEDRWTGGRLTTWCGGDT